MKWSGHVALIRKKCTYGLNGGKLKERNHLEDLDIDGRKVLIYFKN